jgi:cysteinyl-tRNA synthetase
MDTIESNVAPAGSDDVTSSPDTTAEVDTQPAESTQPVDGGAGDDAGAGERLFAGKYKSPEELEKAYSELQKMSGSLGQKAEIANIIEENFGVSPEQFKALMEQRQQERDEQIFRENPGAYAVQKVQALEAQLAEREERAKLDSFLSQNPEYADFADDIWEFGLMPRYQEKPFDEIAREKFGKAIANGQQSAYKKIATKESTQPTAVTSTPNRSLSEEAMRNMSSEELAALLPHADTSGRL